MTNKMGLKLFAAGLLTATVLFAPCTPSIAQERYANSTDFSAQQQQGQKGQQKKAAPAGAATSQKPNTGTGMGGTATSGTGVRTGKGPLSQPIPPATSTTNPQQNPQRPQNTPGPAQTNPPQEPFGSR
jgi:hypothetical protein